jgi:uncharacterized protein (TIGR02444 family)
MPRASRPGNPFWTYSLRLYRKAGVAPACLALQDRLGIDVNVLLFCLFAGDRGIKLPGATLKLMTDLSLLWSSNVVGPLRGTRRFLKPLGLPVLRAEVARVELSAERIEQDLLIRLLPRAARRPRTGRAEPAAANLAGYFQRCGPRLGPGDVRHVLTILAAAFPKDRDLPRYFR